MIAMSMGPAIKARCSHAICAVMEEYIDTSEQELIS
jgi:hypothetical protein